mgnify:CR=1 FL=1
MRGIGPLIPGRYAGIVVVIFTDLDGTLLDHHTYGIEPARPVLERLNRAGVPVVFCTSKTRAETEYWRSRTGNHSPFVAENGAAAFIPRGHFPFPAPGAILRDNYEVLEFGTPYAQLLAALAKAEMASGCPVRAFHRMQAPEIAALAALPLEQAELARLREYDEPFQILDPGRESQLLKEIESQGLRWTRGGRFCHITGGHDKSSAVQALAALYRRTTPNLVTVALGDGLNDAPMLLAADRPVIMPSAHADRLLEIVPHARLAPEPGPSGWARVISEMIPE